jgi:hypothetical protein
MALMGCPAVGSACSEAGGVAGYFHSPFAFKPAVCVSLSQINKTIAEHARYGGVGGSTRCE